VAADGLRPGGRGQRIAGLVVIALPIHASLSLWIWSWDPTVALGTLALAAGYVWLLRGRDRGLEWSPQARIYFAAGLLTLFLALESPIDVGGDRYLFSLHMLQHLLLAMVVPPLILLGLPERWLTLSRFSVSPLVASAIFKRAHPRARTP
jgi:cytochrome c oxidase assembly factor CtaG